MRKKLRIYFTDFWPGFKKEDNFFINFLKRNYDVELSPENPDYLFYSVFGNSFREYSCVRIHFTGENTRPNLDECDFAFSFDFPENNPRLYRLPHYAQYANPEVLTHKPPAEEILKEKTRFCNFVYSNPNCKKRNDFFKKLSKYKRVDSGGRSMNNIGGPVPDKIAFIRDYKFSIAFENESYPGYTTEKIFEPMLANSLPIYWGNPLVHKDFNPKSFLNYPDYGSDEALIERIIEIDKDDSLYLEYMSQPWFHGNKVNEYVDYGNIQKQFDYIFNSEIEPVAKQSAFFSNSPAKRKAARVLSNASYKAGRVLFKIKKFRPYKLVIKYNQIFNKW